jgi:integrase
MKRKTRTLEENVEAGTVSVGDIRRWQNWNKADKSAKYDPKMLVEAWLDEKMESGCKTSYVEEFLAPAVRTYNAFCEALEKDHWDSKSVGEFIRFLLLEKHYATKTINDKFQKPIEMMFKWLCLGGYISNHLDKSAYPRLVSAPKKRKPVQIETVRAILNNLGKLPFGKRQTLQFYVFVAWNTGFRPSDVINLKWSDIDFEEGKISIIPIKTSRLNRKHTVYMSEEFKQFLLMFKETNPPTAANGRCDPYFIEGNDRYQSVIQEYLNKTSPVKIVPTDFRRAVASRAQEIFGNIEQVKSTVGWTSTQSAKRYITETDKTKKENWEAISQDLLTNPNTEQQ